KILGSIDYDEVKRKRVENFHYLHKELGNRNLLHIDSLEGSVPMAYPFRTANTEVRSRLLSNRVYCATYWPNVADWCNPGDLEIRLMAEVIPLPIDQRYNIEDMNTILQY